MWDEITYPFQNFTVHPTLFWARDCFPILGFKLIHISKKGSCNACNTRHVSVVCTNDCLCLFRWYICCTNSLFSVQLPLFKIVFDNMRSPKNVWHFTNVAGSMCAVKKHILRRGVIYLFGHIKRPEKQNTEINITVISKLTTISQLQYHLQYNLHRRYNYPSFIHHAYILNTSITHPQCIHYIPHTSITHPSHIHNTFLTYS